MAVETRLTDIDDGDTQVIEVTTGPRGPVMDFITGSTPPTPEVGHPGDMYLISTGSSDIGDLYKKSIGGWELKGNIRGPVLVNSVNSKTGAVVITAPDITAGKFGIGVIPTGNTATTVALGNHTHAGVYEPVISSGTTSQYLRGDKTWASIFSVAVDLSSAQTISGTKTFSSAPVVPDNSFTIAKVNGLQAGLTSLAADRATVSYVQSRGTDLIANGYGTLGNNTNFSQFTFTAADAPTGAAGSFLSPAYSGGFVVDEFLPVDPSKKMAFSFQLRETGTATMGRFYGSLQPYDAYKNSITPSHYMFIPNTLTTLAQPLNPGDTQIHLTSSANWYGQEGKPAGGSTHLRSIIFWDYTDPGGKLWPEETYSRNFYGTNKWADGGISGNVITLSAPYDGPAKPAGTKLSNGSSGGTYIYSQVNLIASQSWTSYTASISGVVNGGGAPVGQSATFSTGWPQGIGYVKVGWLLNRNEPGSRMAVAAVSFSDATAAQAMATTALAVATTHTHTKSQITDFSHTHEYVPLIDTRTTPQLPQRVNLNYTIDSNNPNLHEVKDSRGQVITWHNEAGQLRFRNPYSTWADSGVRGVIESGDYTGTALGGGNFIELVNRNVPEGPARKTWGIRWATGKTVRNGVEVPDLFVRQAASDPIPSSVPADTLVVTLDGERNLGGSIVHTWSSSSDPLPTIVGGVTVDSFAVVSPESLKIANTASTAFARFDMAATEKVSVRFYMRTPSAWPSNAATIATMRPTPSTTSASVYLTGTALPGRLRLISTGGVTVAESPQILELNKTYRIELRYDSSRSMGALAVYEFGEDVAKWTSGMKITSAYSSSVYRIEIGRPMATPAISDWYIDGIEILQGAFGPVGRHSADTLSPTAQPKPPYAGPLSYWDGNVLWPVINH